MKKFVIYFMICISSIGVIEAHSIEDIRNHFKLAVNDAGVAERLSKKLKTIKEEDALLLAYKASVEALRAKHAWSPYAKLQQMNSFEKLMNQAIELEPDDLEIRFLRYSIQYNTPVFLGFSGNMKEDREMIVKLFLKKRFNTRDKKLIQEVYEFMSVSNSLSAIEKKQMQQILKSI